VKACLDFAKAHKDWTIDDRKRVIWSDESKINRFCSDGRSWYWARDGESVQGRHIKQTVKHGGGSIMVWGCMTAQGPGYLCKIEGTMDQHLYKSILEDELSKTIEYYEMDADKVIFQHDNDPKHRAKRIQEWLSDQSFEILEWPPQSPDLNPIEHLWAHLKRQLNKYDSPPKGILAFWERVEAEWNKIDACT
jgi:DDE superfamily endonuclease